MQTHCQRVFVPASFRGPLSCLPRSDMRRQWDRKNVLVRFKIYTEKSRISSRNLVIMSEWSEYLVNNFHYTDIL